MGFLFLGFLGTFTLLGSGSFEPWKHAPPHPLPTPDGPKASFLSRRSPGGGRARLSPFLLTHLSPRKEEASVAPTVGIPTHSCFLHK